MDKEDPIFQAASARLESVLQVYESTYGTSTVVGSAMRSALVEIDRAHGLLGSILDELALAFPGKHEDIDPIREDIKLFLQTKDSSHTPDEKEARLTRGVVDRGKLFNKY